MHPQKIELKKRKVEEENKNFAEVTKEFSQNPASEAVEQMKAMKISDEMVLKVQTKQKVMLEKMSEKFKAM